MKWSSPLTSKLLVEAGGLVLWYDATYFDHPGVAPNAITKVDLITGTTTSAPAYQQLFFIHTERAMASATYVTGSHALKGGVQFGHGSQETNQTIHGDIIQRIQQWRTQFCAGAEHANQPCRRHEQRFRRLCSGRLDPQEDDHQWRTSVRPPECRRPGADGRGGCVRAGSNL